MLATFIIVPRGQTSVAWFSILGALPFSLILPFADLFWADVLTVVINLIIASSFAATASKIAESFRGRLWNAERYAAVKQSVVGQRKLRPEAIGSSHPGRMVAWTQQRYAYRRR